MAVTERERPRIEEATPHGTIVIEAVAHHRNGVGGNGFFVVTFAEPRDERRMLGVVFDNPEDPDGERPAAFTGYCAVFNRVLLAQDVIAFAENSWRGDYYEEALRRGIVRWYKAAVEDEP